MAALLFLLALPLSTTAFADAPIPEEVRRGQVYFQSKKSPDDLYGLDRQFLGKWFDGRKKRDVEEAVLISPAFLSQRLGYLQAEEGWPTSELQRRWDVAKGLLQGHTTFVVRLCALPRVNLFEDDLEEPKPLSAFIPTLRADGVSQALQSTCLEERHGEDLASVTPPWIAQPTLAPILAGRLDVYTVPDDYAIGDFHSATYLLQGAAVDAKSLDLTLTSEGKIRTAHFGAPVPGSPRKRKGRGHR